MRFHLVQRQRLQIACGQRIQILHIKLGRRRAKAVDVKALNQLRHLSAHFNRIRRPQPGHQAQQCHGLHACFAQVAQRQGAEPFGQRFALGAGQQRVVSKFGHRAAQRLDDLDLSGGIGHMVRSSHHMGDAHFGVIHHRCQGIQELTIAPDQYRVGHRRGINRDVPQHAVFPLDALMVQLKAPDTIAAFRPQGCFFILGQRQGCAVIDRWLAHVQLFLALQVQLGWGFKGLIKAANAAQLIRGSNIAFQPFGLALNPVPSQAQPFQVLLDRIDIFFLRALRVGVINTQNELSAGLAGDQEIHQRGAQIADVDISSGRRGKTSGCH